MGKFQLSLKKLESWFERQKRVLPWRNDPSLYRVWISEIMLQQTQVATVIPYFERFIQRFPNVEALASASEEDVLLHWAGLGYYSRARNLHKGAKSIVQNGYFPRNNEEWLNIPGVGPYTAGAICSIAENLPEPILDGNIERVLSRVRMVNRASRFRQNSDGYWKERLWKLSRIFVETAYQMAIRPSVLNQSLMELGATVCTPRGPKCQICPLKSLCKAYQRGVVEEFPPKKKPKEWIRIEERMHCVISKGKNVLLRQRNKGEWREGLWDLIDDTTLNETKKSFGKLISIGKVETSHVVTRHKIKRVTEVWELSNSKKNSDLPFTKWVPFNEPDVPVGSALIRTLKSVHQLIGRV